MDAPLALRAAKLIRARLAGRVDAEAMAVVEALEDAATRVDPLAAQMLVAAVERLESRIEDHDAALDALAASAWGEPPSEPAGKPGS